MFLPSQDQQVAIDTLRRFLDSEVEPVVLEYKDRFIPKETMIQIIRGLTDYGLIVAPYPEEFGGLGLDWETHMRLFEELCYTSSDIGLALSINAIVADLLIKHAPDASRELYLPKVMSGESLISICVSEPSVGSDVAAVSVRARRDGSDYVINGEKTWITNGDYSDFLVVTAVTGDNADRGLTHILVRREDGYQTRSIRKIALNSQSTAQVFFDNVRVPITNRIGKEGGALTQTFATFEVARIFVAFWAIGVARRALSEALRYTTQRSQHGKMIAGHQLVAGKLAEMATAIEAARGLALRAVEVIRAGQNAAVACSMAKWFACEMAIDVTRDAVHLHGANGITRDFLVEKLHREAMILPNPDGTTFIQKLLIARSLTGVNAFR